jgi:hypothetical protein
MMGQDELNETPRGRFMQVVQAELDKFERHETEFLRSDREERAARLPALVHAGEKTLPH